jgi:integrase
MGNVKQQRKRRDQSWPFIRFSARDNSWKVDARTKDGGSRRFFATRGEAETFAQQCRVKKENMGTSAFGNAELAKYGKTVQHAIEHYLAHLRSQERSITVEQAIVELLAARRSAGRNERYCKDLALRLGRFAKVYKDTTVASIDARTINAWLAGLGVAPGTRNTFRRDLRTLFSFCAKHGYCQTNEAAKTERANDVDKPAGVFTPSQTAALLEACGDDTLPFVAIGLFAGLRASELQKLDWGEVDLESGHIEVTAAKAKTARRRLVPISQNLRAWIIRLVKPHGLIAPRGLRKRLSAVRARAGIAAWPHNALRHSYGSYRLAECHDTARVALEMGNSPQMVFAHYRELVKPKDAERYWSLIPFDVDADKIVAMA